MKKILLFAIISLFTLEFSVSFAQRGKPVDFTRAGLPSELQAYLDLCGVEYTGSGYRIGSPLSSTHSRSCVCVLIPT